MNISIEAKIQCPFYMGFKGTILCCEGFVENTCMTTKFPTVSDRTDYIKAHCYMPDGGKCMFAKNLYEKYRLAEEKENEKARLRSMKAMRK